MVSNNSSYCNQLGKQYQNDIFVGDIKNGNLYDFKLNQSRTGLLLNDTLANKVTNTPQDSEPVLFASGFDGGITDYKLDIMMVISMFLHLQDQYIE